MNHKTLLPVLLLFSSLLLGNNYYYFQKITDDSDFTFGPVKTLCEDKDGLIWFGCNNGLYHHNTINIEKADFNFIEQNESQSININDIYKDSANNIWVCSERGIFKKNKTNKTFDIKRLYTIEDKTQILSNTRSIIQLENNRYLINTERKAYYYEEGDSIVTLENRISDNITHITKDDNSTIYIITNTSKLYISKDNCKTIELLYASDKRMMNSVCKDGNKYLVGYSENGIDIINTEGTKVSELNYNLQGNAHLLNNRVREIIKRSNGEIWIATHIGVIVLQQNEQTLLNSKAKYGLPHRSIYSMYKGKNNSVWLGTFAGGVAYFNESNYAFKSILIDYDKNLQVRSIVSSFCEDEDHHIWIGSEDEGSIRVYNPKEDKFNNKFDNKHYQDIKSIKALSCLQNNTISIGRIFSGDLLFYNYKTKRITTKTKLSSSYEAGIFFTQFHHPNLWIAGRRRITEYNVETKQNAIVFDLSYINGSGRIWYIFLDSSHNLWICTDSGLYMKSKGSDIIKSCFKDNNNYNLGDETIYTACEDNNGNIWVGTKGRGIFVYSYENNSISKAPNYNLTKNADIHSLIRDKDRNIWYNTNKGLYRYSITNNKTSHFSDIDGLPKEHIRPNSAFCSESGDLYFGSINGFSIIDPSIVKENTIVPNVHISEININNEALDLENSVYSNTQDIMSINKLILKSNQNTISFKAISNNYIKPEKNRFMYRLVNYNDNWIEVGQNHNISFTRIPSGKYIFEVLGSNNDNLWSDKPYRLEIQILSPIYLRWYALLLYFILLALSSYLIIRDINTKLKLRKEITNERFKSQANDHIYAERIKFFTNISHELRTPLSLIISPVRSLLEKNSYDEQSRNLLKVVDRNAKRLLKITDQTLDFRLLEVGKLTPNFEKKDIIEIATDVYLCFEQQIIDKQINFSFTSEFEKLEAIIDGDMIEKVMYNLLSNAIKYTKERDHIVFSIKKGNIKEEDYKNYICSGKRFTGKSIEISIQDTGKGIKSDLLPHIFERFSKGTEAHQTSSGIGLHICKEYSEMNDGNILIKSNEGIGSSFILSLPIKEDTNFQKNKDKEIVKHQFTESIESEETETISHEKTFKSTVLLTEDNDDLRTYLKTFLNKHFTVITAKSGEHALDVLSNLTPDLLITDLSMPGISGIELIKELKSNPEKKQIPIIMMTAHTDRKYQMESILCGADTFLTKPIEESLLLAHANNIISKHRVKPSSTKVSEDVVDSETFIQNIEKIIETNLHNTQFGINSLLDELNISKSTLDRKIKAETHQNPSSFIRDIRLKNAIKLMNTNKFNIDEIATYVGFNSSSYFIRTFKNKYGITPREYKKKNIQK